MRRSRSSSKSIDSHPLATKANQLLATLKLGSGNDLGEEVCCHLLRRDIVESNLSKLHPLPDKMMMDGDVLCLPRDNMIST